MLVRSAEESFGNGMRAFSRGRRREALAFFEAAIELERKFQAPRPQARYLSFYGLCLGLSRRKISEAVQLCRAAVTLEEFNPEFHLNLAQVLLAADRRREAYSALVAGLRLQPNHKGLIRLVRGMGMRRRPTLPFLARSNPLNVLLGRLRGPSARRLARIEV